MVRTISAIMRKALAASALVAAAWGANAQDVHFSQYDAAPLFYNPSMAGNYDGDFRFIGNLKHQWSVYQTYMLSFDMLVPENVLKLARGRLGIGGLIVADQAGTTSYGSSQLHVIPAYHVALDRKKTSMLSAGLDLSMRYFSLDAGAITSENVTSAKSFEGINSDGNLNVDAALGLNYHSAISGKYPYNVGLTLTNLFKSGGSFVMVNEKVNTPRKFVVSGNAEVPVTIDAKLMPSVIWSKSRTFNEILGGTYFRYGLERKTKVINAFYLGTWYRWQDAVIAGLAVDIPLNKNSHTLNVGMNYDITVSNYRATSLKGSNDSYEITVKYIIKKKGFGYTPPNKLNPITI